MEIEMVVVSCAECRAMFAIPKVVYAIAGMSQSVLLSVWAYTILSIQNCQDYPLRHVQTGAAPSL
jgi:hypothetical protein